MTSDIDFTFTLQDKYLLQIRDNRKTVEGRLFKNRFRDVRRGNTIKFTASYGNSVICTVEKVVQYKTFRDMLTEEGLRNCLPDATSIDEGVRVYHSINGYEEGEKEFGVVAFRIKVIQSGCAEPCIIS